MKMKIKLALLVIIMPILASLAFADECVSEGVQCINLSKDVCAAPAGSGSVISGASSTDNNTYDSTNACGCHYSLVCCIKHCANKVAYGDCAVDDDDIAPGD
jgi:hypothetical protein